MVLLFPSLRFSPRALSKTISLKSCSFNYRIDFNRHYAEFAGYWEGTDFLTDSQQNIENGTKISFYDSGWKGSPLFTVPIGRSWQDWLQESKKHGWPSFRDSEVDWDFARVLPGGEMVSIWGTHLGHNLPDDKGNRYCISKYTR